MPRRRKPASALIIIDMINALDFPQGASLLQQALPVGAGLDGLDGNVEQLAGLEHSTVLRHEEGRGGGLPLLLIGQSRDRGSQLVDGQVGVAAHRGDLIRGR